MEILNVLCMFAPIFSHRVWDSALVLLIGVILAPGKRTVSAILRVMGLSQASNFQTYYRVLNRTVWSSLAASRILLMHLIGVFAPTGALVMGLDDTIERRRGSKIAAKGIYRDPVRSSQGHFVKTSGLRWLSLQLLVPIPWAQRIWGLPFLTVLAPSKRYNQAHRRRHKRLTDWARQMLLQVRRWLPNRAIVVVTDSSFAALELLAAVTKKSTPVHLVTRLRLDAQLYDPAPTRSPGTIGRPRKVGKRLPKISELIDNQYTPWQSVVMEDWYGQGNYTLEFVSSTAVWYHTGMPTLPIRWVLIRDPQGRFEPQSLLCTDGHAQPIQIMKWFRMRWQLEVTFEEVRAHLGVETQRQWSDKAILRTTPALLALFSIVTAVADHLQNQHPFVLPQAAWYQKNLPTFADALALVRQSLWQLRTFQMSMDDPNMVKVPKDLFDTWSDLLCYAA